MPEESKTNGKVSRRKFLKGVGGGIATTAAITSGGLLTKEAAAAIFNPDAEIIAGSQTIQLNINGKNQSVTVEPRTTLLCALREKLELTGSKEVCDRGQCGACTVHVDGELVLSCMSLALDLRGKKIVTIEGLAKGDQLTVVQQAFIEKDALMCGFCTPGFVMAATTLLQNNLNPTLDQIKQGLAGNTCRCGTYPKLFEAVQAAAKTMRKGV